jgi:hypothetical protein
MTKYQLKNEELEQLESTSFKIRIEANVSIISTLILYSIAIPRQCTKAI